MISDVQTPPPYAFRTERRENQDSVEIALEFYLTDTGREFHGFRLSHRILSVHCSNVTGTAPVVPLLEKTVTLRIPLSGFDLVMDVHVVPMDGGCATDAVLRYRILESASRSASVLQQLVRLMLTGVLPSAEDVVNGIDDETLYSPSLAVPENETRSRAFYVSAILASILAIGLAGVSLGLGLFQAITTIPASAAVLVAPKFDLVSMTYGKVRGSALIAGSSVERDQLLLEVGSADLDADITSAMAKVSYLDAALGSLEDGSTDTFPVLFSLQAGEGRPTDLSVKAARIARDYERGLLTALKLRRADLSLFANCRCTVLWAAEPGSVVVPGGRVVTLMPRALSDRRVWASFPAEQVAHLHVGQVASVRFPGLSGKLNAAVETLRFDPDLQPLAGLEAWGSHRSGQIAILLRLSEVPRNIAVGTSVDVSILK